MSNPITKIRNAFHLPKPPAPMVIVLIIGGVAGLIPLGMVAKARTNTNKKNPRIHLWLDMDNQAKIKAQAESPVFADGRGNRLPVPGTVAQSQLRTDDHLYLGFQATDDLLPVLNDGVNVWYDGLPAAVTRRWGGHSGGADGLQLFIQRGQDQYQTYCFTCHGMGGLGDGPTHTRANALMRRGDLGTTTTWAPPANLVQKTDDGQLQFGRAVYPDGELFDVISNGKGNMAGYRAQISAEDRWAIVAYVRALQTAE